VTPDADTDTGQIIRHRMRERNQSFKRALTR